MLSDKKLLIVGGDLRQELLYEILNNKGYYCTRENSKESSAFERLVQASVIILPVPVSSDGKNVYSDNSDFKLDLSEFSKKISPRQLVLGGMFKRENKDIFNKNNVIYKDFGSFEHFLSYNAFLTAQGALRLLFDNTNSLLTGKRVLVTGFGRIGKALSNMLKNLNMEVFVAARNDVQLTEAVCLGYKTVRINDISSVIYLFDFIFNTVPENIFTECDIYHMRTGCTYFELASEPFGAKKEHFDRSDKKYVAGGGLPGKYVSYSAAKKIGELVENLI